MNPRIKELFKQTSLHRNDHTTEQRIAEIEKFAELIVRECISCSTFIGITTHNSGLGPQPIRYTSMVNDKIRKHFGVEE